jgi:hypothetical protein
VRRNRLPEGLVSVWGGRGQATSNKQQYMCNTLSGSMDKSIITSVIWGWETSTLKIRSSISLSNVKPSFRWKSMA